MQGYLHKRGDKGPIKKWRKRYFVLSGSQLVYYADEQMKESLGKIDLNTAISIHPSSSNTSTSKENSSSETEVCYFQIDCPGRIFYLLTDNSLMMQKWIDALNESKQIYNPRFSYQQVNQPNQQQNKETYNGRQTIIPSSFQPSAPFDSSSMYGDFTSFLHENRASQRQSRASDISTSSYESGSDDISDQVQQRPFDLQHQFYQPPSYLHPDFFKYRPASVTENTMKEYFFTEGNSLKQYLDQYLYCCNIVTSKEAKLLPQESEEKKKLICIYLGVRTLDWDNRDSFSAYSESGYEMEIANMYAILVDLIQRRLLGTWKLDAPTILTKIDTWIKRKKSLQQILFLRGDRESIVKWNITLLYNIKQRFLPPSQFHELDHAISGLINMLWYQLSQVPASFYANQVWSSLDTTCVSENDRTIVKNLLEASLTFQKLKLEIDEIGFGKNDPYLINKFEAILGTFPQAKQSSSLAPLMPSIRNTEMKLFASWPKQHSLLKSNSQNDKQFEQFSLYLKNQRWCKRIAVKVNKAQFPKLQDVLLECAAALDERTPKIEQNDSSVPFPDSGADIITDLIQSLSL